MLPWGKVLSTVDITGFSMSSKKTSIFPLKVSRTIRARCQPELQSVPSVRCLAMLTLGAPSTLKIELACLSAFLPK